MSGGERDRSSFGEFVIEAEELLEALADRLAELERAADAGGARPETVNDVFRSMHTLKGLSGMLGLGGISELSHRLETLLDKVRLGRVELHQGAIDALFAGLEALTKLVASVGRSGTEEGVDIQAVTRRIGRVLEEKPGGRQGGGLAGIDLDQRILGTLTEYEEHRLLENLRAGNALCRVEARFSFETFDREKLGELTERLKRIGEVVSTLPSSDEASPGTISFDLVVGTAAGPDAQPSKVWYRCTRCRHAMLVDFDQVTKSQEDGKKKLHRAACQEYRPENTYTVGQAIFHTELDDVGKIVSKLTTSDGAKAIVVSFERIGERRLLESVTGIHEEQ